MIVQTVHSDYVATVEPDQEKKIKIVTRNRKARHDYKIVDTIEAGIELLGSEVKSIRLGKINLADGYALIQDGQLYLRNMHISPYEMASGVGHEPTRQRRLLLHRREIKKLAIKTEQRGLTLIPLTVYFKGKNVKIELALATGRRKYDKRQEIAKKESDRKIKQALKKDLGK